MSQTRNPKIAHQKTLIHARADLLGELGAHEGPFEWSEIPPWGEADVRKLMHSPVLEKAETPAEGAAYKLVPVAQDYLRKHLETRETILSCGHAGMENHGHYYECGYEGCYQKFYADEFDGGASA